MTVPGLPAQGSTSWYPWAANIHDLVVTSPGGRLTLEAYDDMTVRTDGALAGQTLAISGSGLTWSTTGANPPTVSSGRMVSAGVGYSYIQLPAAGRLIAAGVEFSAGSNFPFAMAWVTGPSWDLTNLTGHFSVGPEGFGVTIKRGGTFYNVFGGTFRRPLDTTAGKIHTMAIGIVGDSYVVQVNGETFTGPPDPRTKSLAGAYVFWEPLTASGQTGKAAWIAAWSESPSGAPLAPNLFVSNADLTQGESGQVVGNRYQMGEAVVGKTPVNGQPGISFGAKIIYTELTTAMTAGTTTIVTKAQIPPGSTVVIEEAGANEETRVTNSYPPETSSPYSHTITVASTSAHPVGTVVVATPDAAHRAEMYFHQNNQYWIMPNTPYVVFPGENLFLGTDMFQRVTKYTSGVLGSYGVGPGGGAWRSGPGWTTAGRPAASAVGEGSQGYDTDLNIPIWSDGTNWKNAAGTIV